MLLNEIIDLTNNPNFQSWFKGSKVVDEHGNPLKVYHGTNADITHFTHEFLGKSSGNIQYGSSVLYTTNYPHTASGYADTRKDNAVVYPLYLSIKNPLNSELRKRLTKVQIKNLLQLAPDLSTALENYGDIEYEGFNKVFREALDSMFEYQEDTLLKTLFTINNDFFPYHNEEFLKAVYKVLKYDGVQVDFPDGEKYFIAFFSNQIKSIFNTKFSKKSDHIGESLDNG
jgi:hypothetical protein